MSHIECPYCEADCGIPDEHEDAGVSVQMECESCHKNFVYYAEYSVDYYSDKAPCLNGEEHKWEQIIGAPREYFIDRYRCKYCDEEKKLTEIEINKLKQGENDAHLSG